MSGISRKRHKKKNEPKRRLAPNDGAARRTGFLGPRLSSGARTPLQVPRHGFIKFKEKLSVSLRISGFTRTARQKPAEGGAVPGSQIQLRGVLRLRRAPLWEKPRHIFLKISGPYQTPQSLFHQQHSLIHPLNLHGNPPLCGRPIRSSPRPRSAAG